MGTCGASEVQQGYIPYVLLWFSACPGLTRYDPKYGVLNALEYGIGIVSSLRLL